MYLIHDPLATDALNVYKPYVDLAVRTAAPFDNPRMHMLHALQGMANELLEIDEGFAPEGIDGSYFEKEVGDFFWFLALYQYYTAGQDFEKANKNFYDRVENSLAACDTSTVSVANAFVSIVKKEIYYGKTVDPDTIELAVQNALSSVLGVCEFLADDIITNHPFDYNVKSILTKNIAKLSSRYAMGHFDKAAATVRDEAAEHAAVIASTVKE